MTQQLHIDFLEQETEKKLVADKHDIKDLLDIFIRLFEQRRRLQHYHLDIKDSVINTRSQIQHQKQQYQNQAKHSEVDAAISNLIVGLDRYSHSLEDLALYLDERIREMEVIFMQKDYAFFDEHKQISTRESIMRRREFSDSLKQYIDSLNKISSEWRYPAADINPTDAVFSASLVANDPLYVVADGDLLSYVIRKFKEITNPFFTERRLRKYSKIEDLPDNSFGNIYCWGRYEYWPLDPFKDQARLVFEKLKPGGKFYFTYNNCEMAPSLEFCGGFRAYQTEFIVEKMLYGLGFDKVENIEFNNGAHTIMIVKKPGELESQKQATPSIEIVKVIDSQSK